MTIFPQKVLSELILIVTTAIIAFSVLKAETVDHDDMLIDFESIEEMFNNYSRENITESDILNPYAQPNENLSNSYGSGDVNQDGVLSWDDYNEVTDFAPQTDYADIDGDGIPSTNADAELLSQFLNEGISYLPGHWNSLETAEERMDWMENMLAIDLTDEIPYEGGNVEERWISGNYATQIHLNFWGYDGDDIHIKYNQDYLGRFNLPVYKFIYYDPNTGAGHGANAVLIGDNPLNIYDWSYIEPQDDGFGIINQGILNFLAGKDFYISGIEVFDDGQGSPDIPSTIPVLAGSVDENGEYTQTYENPDLMITRPGNMPVMLDLNDEKSIPTGYRVKPNYPNPFNPSTIIEYILPKSENVSIDIYDLNGKQLEILVNGFQNPGTHSVEFDGSKYSSGIYLYNLTTESGISRVGKMILIK